jgi:hypothetical protein
MLRLITTKRSDRPNIQCGVRIYLNTYALMIVENSMTEHYMHVRIPDSGLLVVDKSL